jgi:hypothetical protein
MGVGDMDKDEDPFGTRGQFGGLLDYRIVGARPHQSNKNSLEHRPPFPSIPRPYLR